MSVRKTFESMLLKYGHDVELVRLNPAATVALKAARATINREDPMVHEMSQSSVLFKIRNVDLAGTNFATKGPKKLDRIHEAGEYFTIQHAAPMYEGTNIIGWNIYVSGGHA